MKYAYIKRISLTDLFHANWDNFWPKEFSMRKTLVTTKKWTSTECIKKWFTLHHFSISISLSSRRDSQDFRTGKKYFTASEQSVRKYLYFLVKLALNYISIFLYRDPQQCSCQRVRAADRAYATMAIKYKVQDGEGRRNFERKKNT